MNFLKPKYLPILLFFSSMSFSQMHPEGNCSGYAISGGKLDISKKDQICRFDNLIDYTYENFPENFLYRIGNSSEELDIYKSYKEMMEKFPEDKLINEFGFRRLMKAHMILINYKAVSPKLVGKLEKMMDKIVVSLDAQNQKNLSKHTKTLKGEKSGIHHVSSNGYKAYVEELSFAENHFYEKLAAQKAKEDEERQRLAKIKADEERKLAAAKAEEDRKRAAILEEEERRLAAIKEEEEKKQAEDERKLAIANAEPLDGIMRTLVLTGETQFINDRAVYYLKDLYDGKLPKDARLIRTTMRCYDDFGDLVLNDELKGRISQSIWSDSNIITFFTEDNDDFTFSTFVISNDRNYKCMLNNSRFL